MANVVLKTEEDQAARVTSLPLPPAVAPVEAIEEKSAAPLAFVSTPPSVSRSSASSRRYDQATIEKALAVAMQMQQEHNATLSTEQVVRLGEEINVDQSFMMRALAQIDGTAAEATQIVAPPTQAIRATQTQAQTLTHDQVRGLSPLPLLSRYVAVLIPLLFAFVSFVIFTAPATRLDRSDNPFALLWMFLGGSLFALFLGSGLKRLRLGLLSGFCVGAFLFAAAMLSAPNPSNIRLTEFFTVFFLFVSAGSLLGLTGAALPRLYRRTMIALVRQFPHLAEEAR